MIAALYCMFWTIFDPPKSEPSLKVTGNTNEWGETIVLIFSHCESKSGVWHTVSFSCQGLLLFGGSILVYQMRKVPNSVNDSRELALMIYSSVIILLLRV